MHAVNKGNIWKQNLEQLGRVPRQRLTLQPIPYIDTLNVNVGNLMLFPGIKPTTVSNNYYVFYTCMPIPIYRCMHEYYIFIVIHMHACL